MCVVGSVTDINKFTKTKNKGSKLLQGLKILKKNIIFEKNYWKVHASHDGYLKQYGIIHEREVEFYPEQIKFVGHDKMISKNGIKNLKFEIRFHLEPNIKIMKTQDNKSILIDLGGEGWKFNSDNKMIARLNAMRYVLSNYDYEGKKVLKDKKWSKEIEEYDIVVDGVKFKNLTKEQYELLYKLKGST